MVDDEEGIRVLCRVNLELGGFSVIEAADGASAVALAKSQVPEVIFLDLMMPVMDGYEFRARQLLDPAIASIPIVVITAGHDLDTRSLEAEAVVPKPIDLQELISTVQRIC